MSILSIDDLKHATDDEIEKAKAEVLIMDDLENYIRWLSSPSGMTTTASITVGYGKRGLGIHPSSACKKGICPLVLLYECTGEVVPHEPFDHQLRWTWDLGTALHELLQMHLNNMYEDQFEAEVKLIDDDLHIHSRADGILSFPMVKGVLEIKSIREGGNYGFAKIQILPFEDNVRQAHFYMKVSDSPFANIFYICKNNSKMMEHAVAFDPNTWDELVAVIEPVIDAAYNGGKTPRAKIGPHCRRCKFFKGCTPAQAHENGERRAIGFSRRVRKRT